MALGIVTTSASVAGGLGSLGGRKLWFGFVQLDSSYPTGGYSFDPTMFGITQVAQMYLGQALSANVGTRYSHAAGGSGKLQAFTLTTGVEIANTTNLAGLQVPVMVVGV